MTDAHKKCRALQRLDEVLGIVTKLVAIIGALFALYLFLTGQSAERKRVFLEEVIRAKSPEVTQALVRLDYAYEQGRLGGLDVRLDIAYVLTWYDHLGMLWIQDPFADKCVIKAAVTPYATLLAIALDAVRVPVERRTYFDLLRNKMADYPC